MLKFFGSRKPAVILLSSGLILLAAIGFWMVIFATVWGTGWISDSYQYIGAARSLAHRRILAYPTSGDTLVPLTRYPPAFPVVLAGFEWLGWDSYHAVRYFHAILFSLNIILIGATAYRVSHSALVSLFSSLLALSSGALLERHAWALSEPLFITMILGSFLLVDVFYQTNKRIYLICASICLASACLTRYIGIAAFVTVLLLLVILRQRPWKRTMVNIALTFLIPLIPLLLWTARSFQVENQVFNRDLTFTPLGIKNWLSIIQTLAGWLLPVKIIYGREIWVVILGSGFMIMVIALWLYEAKRRKTSPIQMLQPVPLIPLYILFSLVYIPSVIIGKLFFDPMIGFTERMLIPTQLSVIFLVPLFVNFLWKQHNWLGKTLSITLAIMLLFYYTNESLSRLERLNRQGLGVASRRWHESHVIKALQTLEGGRFYSNSQSTLYLWRGEAGYYFTKLANETIGLGESPIYLVVFYHLKPNARLQKWMDELPIIMQDQIATIYQYPPEGINK